jgi:hypothetical protein
MALAVAPDAGQVTWATHAANQQSADQAALDNCGAAINGVCTVIAEAEDGCNALAIDPATGIWQGGCGPNPDAASGDAVATSPNSQLKSVGCSWV